MRERAASRRFQQPRSCDVARGDADPRLGLAWGPGDVSSLRVSAKHAESSAGKVAFAGNRNWGSWPSLAASISCQ